jgi:molybdopterin/thiamine biosynthesis adenylyltransferase
MNKREKHLIEKYSRQIMMDQIGISGQKKIFNSSVSVIGCGGLGTSAAQYLSMSGLGGLTLIDDDKVSLSNLNRQTLFSEKDVGKSKSLVLSERIKSINNSIKIIYFKKKVTSKNIKRFVGKDKIVLDCTDNYESRLVINKFCHLEKKILISAALQNFELQAFMTSSWSKHDNPCYKCIFPELNKDTAMSCDEMGIIAPVAGLGGLIQANLAINFILKLKSNFKELILFDCLNLDLKKIKITKNKKCTVCN